MLPMDCHTHTNASPDSDATLAEMCERAQMLGMQAYAVTDHVELCRFFSQPFYDVPPPSDEDVFDYGERYERFMQTLTLAKHNWNSPMQLICGVELGQPNADFGLADSLVRDKRLDFVIASLHELPDRADFYFLDYQKEDVTALLDSYFSTILEICQWGNFDILGHLTYPLRYIEGEVGIPVDLTRWQDCIAASFEALIQKGKGIELNTSGYRQAYGRPFPDTDLLHLYHDLGGTILSIGSDAHCPADVGGGIAQGIALAKSVGFDHLCYFLRHQPHWIEI